MMDLTTEKAELIKQLENINDLSLVIAVKSLLDFGTAKHSQEKDTLLEASIQRGLEDAKNNLVTPHEEAFSKFRIRYSK